MVAWKFSFCFFEWLMEILQVFIYRKGTTFIIFNWNFGIFLSFMVTFLECVNWSFPLGWQPNCLALGCCAVLMSFFGAVSERVLLGQTMGLSNTLLYNLATLGASLYVAQAQQKNNHSCISCAIQDWLFLYLICSGIYFTWLGHNGYGYKLQTQHVTIPQRCVLI